MAKNTITFELGGRVDVRRLKEGISAFYGLMTALTDKTGVSWVVKDLKPGSAVITVQGEADDPAKVEQIVGQFGEIGKALKEQEDISDGYWVTNARVAKSSDRITKAVSAIQKLAGSKEYLRFKTEYADYKFFGNRVAAKRRARTSVLGSVTGEVQTVSNRGGLQFNLYDSLLGKMIVCHLAPGQEDLMREAWGRRVRVSGRVSRDRATGRPITVKRIVDVEILEDGTPGSYKMARGAVPWEEGDPLPEDVIRRLRDA